MQNQIPARWFGGMIAWLVAAVLLSMPISAEDQLAPPDRNTVDELEGQAGSDAEEVLLETAKSYAADYGVGVNEAMRRLRLQSSLEDTLAKLESVTRNRFAGAWIEHEPTFRLVVRITGPTKEIPSDVLSIVKRSAVPVEFVGGAEMSQDQVMKNPALTGGVSLKLKLRLTRLLLALVPNIVPNRRFVDTDRRDEESSCPDSAPIPVHFGQIVREFLFHPTTCYTLQRLHHFRHRVFRRNHHVQMHMIAVHPHFLYEPIRVKFPHSMQRFLKILGYSRHEDSSSIPRHPDNVILRLVNDVRLPMEFHRLPS